MNFTLSLEFGFGQAGAAAEGHVAAVAADRGRPPGLAAVEAEIDLVRLCLAGDVPDARLVVGAAETEGLAGGVEEQGAAAAVGEGKTALVVHGDVVEPGAVDCAAAGVADVNLEFVAADVVEFAARQSFGAVRVTIVRRGRDVVAAQLGLLYAVYGKSKSARGYKFERIE